MHSREHLLLLPSDQMRVLGCVDRLGQRHGVLEMELGPLLQDLLYSLFDEFALLAHRQRVQLVVGETEPRVDFV